MSLRTSILCCVVALASFAWAMPEDVSVTSNIVYANRNGRGLRLDIYRNSQFVPLQPVPTVVYVHGGAWRDGRKDQPNPVLWALAQRGFIGVSIEYRLSTTDVFPAQLEDCRAALKWLRREAATWGIDRSRIGIWGNSAGGHLASLVATSGDESGDEDYHVQACVALFPTVDLIRLVEYRLSQPNVRGDLVGERSPEWQLLGGDPRRNVDLARRANPLSYISPTDPPFLILHGTLDRIVPLEQSLLLHNGLRERQVRSELRTVPGMDHELRYDLITDMLVDFFLQELR